MERDEFLMPKENEPQTPELQVVKIANGLGFGEGSISTHARLEEGDLTPEIMRQVDEGVNSVNILVDVNTEVQDDGCSDGRGVKRVFLGFIEKAKSLHRPKVFGGGLTMAVSSVIGMGRAAGRKLGGVFKTTQIDLDNKSIDYGGHTAEGASDPKSGCGAIDEAPANVMNSVKYRDEITDGINLLSGGEHRHDLLDDVFDNFAAYSSDVKQDTSYKGKKVSVGISKREKVNKELEGPHLEVAIVINTIDGKTVNQEYIRQITRNKAQVFAIDEWRLREIADDMYDTDQDRQKAYLSMLVYTLGTSATLTKGDLPIYVISAQTQPELIAA